jgi:hypothetical protein
MHVGTVILEKNVYRCNIIVYLLSSSSNGKINSADKLPTDSEFICDMCMEKFNEPDKLQEHRAKKHSAPTGI